jgi:tRNA-dihydrouridine synthase C
MNSEIILAPMEGVLDAPLRGVLTALNHYDYCVSEFIRVNGVVYTKKIFYREVPELRNGGCTADGTPVWVQLLGSEPEIMARNAKVAVEAGALGIDLNFGCPSKFVHRSNGGAALLKNPVLLGMIIRAVRDALPVNIPVSAKIRLGWESEEEAPEIFKQCIANGADKVIIHARTKKDGYQANTVKWKSIADLKAMTDIPVVANGDVVDLASAQKCRELSTCDSLMLGRYGVGIPNLERVIRNNEERFSEAKVAETVLNYIDVISPSLTEHYQKSRTKQFLGYIRLAYPSLRDVFKQICHEESIEGIKNILVSVAEERNPLLSTEPKNC